MIHLNFSDLSAEAQQKLIEKSKIEVAKSFGVAIKKYARKNNLEYHSLLEEEALRNLYNYSFVFGI